MSYPDTIKNRAQELYLEYGGKIPLVYKKIKEEYGDKSPKQITLRKWFDKDNLSEVQKNLHTDALVKARTSQINKLVERQDQHKEHYRKLIDKAGNVLFGEDALDFVTAMEATKALDVGIQGERKIATEQLNLQFVEDLFNAVLNAVHDEEILKDVGIEFRKILVKYQNENTN